MPCCVLCINGVGAEKAAAEAGKTPEPPPPEVDTSDAALEGLKKFFTPKRA